MSHAFQRIICFLLATTLSWQPFAQTKPSNIKRAFNEVVNFGSAQGEAVVYAFIFNALTVFLHEFGHAKAAEYYGRKTEIHLFTTTDNTSKPILSLGTINIYGDAMMSGYTNAKPGFPQNSKQDLIFTAAGPTTEVIVSYFFFSLFVAWQKYKKSGNLAGSIGYGLTSFISPYESLLTIPKINKQEKQFYIYFTTIFLMRFVNAIAYGFTPHAFLTGEHGDGEFLWKNLLHNKPDKEELQEYGRYASVLFEAAGIAGTLYSMQKHLDQTMQKKRS